MAKVSARNAAILVGGYDLSTYCTAYTADLTQDMLEATGFGDGWKNYIPGERSGQISLDLLWDSAAGKSVTALKGLDSKLVTILPETYALGLPCISMHAQQAAFHPGGAHSEILKAGSIVFQGAGTDAGPLDAVALQHGTITNTLTGTAFQGLAVAEAHRSGGFLHIWQSCAADTYQVKIRHCATAGGTYADLITFTLNGSAVGSEHVTAASTTIQPWWRIEATRTGAAGNTFGFTVSFWIS